MLCERGLGCFLATSVATEDSKSLAELAAQNSSLPSLPSWSINNTLASHALQSTLRDALAGEAPSGNTSLHFLDVHQLSLQIPLQVRARA